jgi:hypothetical protein
VEAWIIDVHGNENGADYEEQHNRLVRKPGCLSRSLAVFQAKSLTKLRFLMEVVRKLKFPNNSNKAEAERQKTGMLMSA